MDPMIKEWTVFLDRCLNQRVQADVFDAAVAQLHRKSPIPGRKLVALLLKPRSPNANSVDPRVIVYLERLLALRDRKSTRLNSSHMSISYAVFCLKKKKINKKIIYMLNDI